MSPTVGQRGKVLSQRDQRRLERVGLVAGRRRIEQPRLGREMRRKRPLEPIQQFMTLRAAGTPRPRELKKRVGQRIHGVMIVHEHIHGLHIVSPPCCDEYMCIGRLRLIDACARELPGN